MRIGQQVHVESKTLKGLTFGRPLGDTAPSPSTEQMFCSISLEMTKVLACTATSSIPSQQHAQDPLLRHLRLGHIV